MAWTVEVAPRARKALGKLDRQVANRIIAMLEDISALEDPRIRGHALTGKFLGLWRYRVGDWRVIVKIEEGRLVIVVVAVGNRRDVYRDK
ncbi:type II toxin-antitoxin system RelE/ParE family toxin [Sphingomonas sp. 28-62-20]|uniref:type II toxin-antitoxin system RelE family toxin n=1 Tax=Sphingomonas sp. 28-62-20 TaxID=1970433 RepID=UPI0035A97416